jgi:hypothetical protein
LLDVVGFDGGGMLPNENDCLGAAGVGADAPKPNEKDPAGRGAVVVAEGAPPKEKDVDGAAGAGADEPPNKGLGVSFLAVEACAGAPNENADAGEEAAGATAVVELSVAAAFTSSGSISASIALILASYAANELDQSSALYPASQASLIH